MCTGLIHLFSPKGLYFLSFYKDGQVFSDELSCRLPVVLTNGETFQNGNFNVSVQ